MADPARAPRPGLKRSLPALLAAAAVLATMASPAEAKRRAHHRGGGGYSPPYAAMVVDVKTGKTLHAVNEDSLRHPASITKVMTLYMLFEQLERGRYTLESPLTISSFAASQSPSKLGLRPGSTISVEDAIKAIVTKSANDVACAIGENIAGSEPRFAEMMTAKAKALGMGRTNYANASGLPDSDQITTARDLTVLARAIQDRFPRYYRYFQTRSFAFRGRVIGNHNRLLGNVQGVDGIKTGYTRDSGFNLMTAARLDDRQIVAIVLGGKSGASRDKIMADLVRANLPRAYAGNRQTPATIEVAERARPAVVADGASRTRTQMASADDEDVETTASTAQPLDISPSRATTTPGSAGVKGRLPANAQAYAPTAPGSPFPMGVKSPARLASVDGPRTESAPKTVSGAKVTPTAWVIQLGAMDDEDKAKSMLAEARSRAGGSLSRAAPYTVKVEHGGATLYRARFSGFSEQDAAQDACNTLKRSGFSCFATRS
ncbi:D-alanyl-D-alanine carboxypeptidase [Methylobacterium sp. Leaf469]|jgi:D-alanyl-D-alanine carboxypeptidase|uniref:D-alanyl-D-alanine carboxypeptidase n=1 Tax=unclassified Methylobacterium TaxID=2615210 RepID=UPI0006F21D56|nr:MULTISPECIES: D-alanyl-D-alanine carboxypeptidase [unclassified Methylobacterium]USU34282.1 D-alanyl-D-alanine carboxypeptidase [Methylobacterium sp. OTU13CASTA1]KQO61924.1 D-alanyl-D-alanine carboxypeptidase [Methylobacterium sp. Leaf87]KQP34066.1 D-alanyl-D-alanine carboxypeptidase [Methylobacterium sp. Leaf102]KQP36462.1 D-alanyl-D-alanine carboxypeptidase [Methylobacterium sp. Leaf100]KQP61962.1 D-alanyl-D-alanine carboxypeptidase [Methylobacterium sp. Leaf112]